MKMNAKALGLALGFFWSVSILLISLVSLQFGVWGSLVSFLSSGYLVYDLSATGILLGVLLGFLDGFVCGWIIAMLYNKFAK